MGSTLEVMYIGLLNTICARLLPPSSGSTGRPSSVRVSTNSGLQEGGGSVFILLWAVSGHHYLTLQKESYKQMLAAHSAATVRLAVAAPGVWKTI